mmetsp:Transcript_16311/g.13974  ORF Transcript_16311/g.13974 Transcript_16311/m.13974 type:complete len:124 (-) Transcript_16311:998-1369(-)
MYILFEISIEKTKRIIKRYFHDSTDTLIKVLNSYPNYQKEILDYILEDSSKNQELKDDTFVLYVKLLCQSPFKNDHNKLLYLLEHFIYPLDDCIKLVKEYNVKEAWAFLEEKRGGYKKALELR